MKTVLTLLYRYSNRSPIFFLVLSFTYTFTRYELTMYIILKPVLFVLSREHKESVNSEIHNERSVDKLHRYTIYVCYKNNK